MTVIGRLLARGAIPGLLPSRDDWTGLPSVTRMTIIGLLVWCLLAGVAAISTAIAIETATWGKAAPLAIAAGGGVAAAAAVSQDPILQRPLFVRSRQAAVTAVPPLLSPPLLVTHDAGVALSGVLINGDMKKAFMTTAQNPAGVWVAPDAVIGGWRLLAVRPGEVELEGSNGRVVLPFAAVAGR